MLQEKNITVEISEEDITNDIQLPIFKRAVSALFKERDELASQNVELNGKIKDLENNVQTLTENGEELRQKICNFQDEIKQQKLVILNNIFGEQCVSIFCDGNGPAKGDSDITLMVLLKFLPIPKNVEMKRKVFSEFDKLLYQTYVEEETRLKEIRDKLTEYLKALNLDFYVEWPNVGDKYDRDIHAAEKEKGSTVKEVLRACIKGADGTVLVKSEVVLK